MRSRTGSVLSILLLLSVALNLFFGSQFAGRALRHAGEPGLDRTDDRGPPPERADGDKRSGVPPGQLLERLPEADRPEAKRIFASHHGDIKARAKSLRDAAADLARIARVEPLDIEALRAGFAAQRSRWDELQTTRQETFLETLKALSPEGRHALIEATPTLRPPR